MADVVYGDAVEGVGMSVLPRKDSGRLVRVGLETCVCPAVVGDVDTVGGDPGTFGVILSGPRHCEGRGTLGGRQGCDAAGRSATSMVLTTVAVFSGALVSKTTDACWLIVVPVMRLALGWTVYWT